MKQLIRKNTFETNSSSTHSLSICSEEEFEKFKNGETLFDGWKEEFKSKQEALESILEDHSVESIIEDYIEYEGYFDKEDYEQATQEEKDRMFDEALEWYLSSQTDYKDYDHYIGDEQEDYETFEQHYITTNGDKIVAFGYYGYDG